MASDEGYFEKHRISIPIHTLSSKIINTVATEDDLHITIKMQKLIEKTYVVESSDSEEEDDEDDSKEGTDIEVDEENHEDDSEEDTDNDEDESTADKENTLLRG